MRIEDIRIKEKEEVRTLKEEEQNEASPVTGERASFKEPRLRGAKNSVVQKKSWPRRLVGTTLYLACISGIVFGLPKFLSWSLHTPYPMAAITSGSMWPALREGDLVFVQGVQREDLKIGDVIVYRNPDTNTFTIHRIVAMGDNTLTTKGDANFEADKPVPYENVVGRNLMLMGRLLHMPYLGSITVFANNVR